MAWECKDYRVWWRAMARSGMKIFVFMAWEYNALEACSKWSLEIVINISSSSQIYKVFTRMLNLYILQRYNAHWVLTCFQAFVEVKLWFNVP
jgi:hypothetical protein